LWASHASQTPAQSLRLTYSVLISKGSLTQPRSRLRQTHDSMFADSAFGEHYLDSGQITVAVSFPNSYSKLPAIFESLVLISTRHLGVQYRDRQTYCMTHKTTTYASGPRPCTFTFKLGVIEVQQKEVHSSSARCCHLDLCGHTGLKKKIVLPIAFDNFYLTVLM